MSGPERAVGAASSSAPCAASGAAPSTSPRAATSAGAPRRHGIPTPPPGVRLRGPPRPLALPTPRPRRPPLRLLASSRPPDPPRSRRSLRPVPPAASSRAFLRAEVGDRRPGHPSPPARHRRARPRRSDSRRPPSTDPPLMPAPPGSGACAPPPLPPPAARPAHRHRTARRRPRALRLPLRSPPWPLAWRSARQSERQPRPAPRRRLAVAARLALKLGLSAAAACSACSSSSASSSPRPPARRAGERPAVALTGTPRRSIPADYLPWLARAADRYRLGPRGFAIVAAVHSIESDFGRSNLPGRRIRAPTPPAPPAPASSSPRPGPPTASTPTATAPRPLLRPRLDPRHCQLPARLRRARRLARGALRLQPRRVVRRRGPRRPADRFGGELVCEPTGLGEPPTGGVARVAYYARWIESRRIHYCWGGGHGPKPGPSARHLLLVRRRQPGLRRPRSGPRLLGRGALAARPLRLPRPRRRWSPTNSAPPTPQAPAPS